VLLVVVVGPLSFELIGPVVLFCTPGAMPVTFTENVQDPFAASVPPERLIALVPAVAVIDPVHVARTSHPIGKIRLLVALAAVPRPAPQTVPPAAIK
jgi:hypothetical protein